jgi:hypothetical protein
MYQTGSVVSFSGRVAIRIEIPGRSRELKVIQRLLTALASTSSNTLWMLLFVFLCDFYISRLPSGTTVMVGHLYSIELFASTPALPHTDIY